MADTPKKDDKLPESEAEERFRRGIAKALATPPRPHKAARDLECDDDAERFDERLKKLAKTPRAKTPEK